MNVAQDRLRLQHMLDAAGKAVRIARGKDKAALDDPDDPLVDALVHLLSVIGEAARKLSPDVRLKLADIPWADVIGMRHRLIHAYFDIDHDILWATVEDSLPALVAGLEKGLEEIGSP